MPVQRKPTISVVIPVFKNGDAIPAALFELKEFFVVRQIAFEVICVDDGSPVPLTLPERAPWLKLLRLEKNIGQQRALALGLAAATADIAVTTDADLPILPEHFMRLTEMLTHDGSLNLALGARDRYLHSAQIRALGSRAVSLMLRILFSYRLKDFGCGTNAVRMSLVRRFQSARIPRSPIKLAMLALCQKYVEVTLPTRGQNGKRSSYTIFRLALLALSIIWFRLASGFSLRKPQP